MDDRKDKTRRGSSGALRDLLVIALVAAVLLSVAAVTGAMESLPAWLHRVFPGKVDEILIGLALASVGLGIFTIMRWRQGLRQLAARQAAEQRYRQAVETIPAVVYTWDPTHLLGTVPAIYVSPQTEAILGFTPEELHADPELWVRQIHPDDHERVLAASAEADRTGEPLSIEYRQITKNGTVVWMREEAVAVARDEHGRPTLVQGVMHDITERKLVQEALDRTDLILRAVGFAAERLLRTASWRSDLPEVLAQLGQAADVSRAYVYENQRGPSDELLMSEVAEWTAPGVVPRIQDADNQRFPYRGTGFEGWEEAFGSGRSVQGHVADFPEPVRQDLEDEGAVSIAVVPISVGDDWWGYLGLHECKRQRTWSEADLDALHAAADTLGAAIGREHAQRRLSEAESRYRTLVEQLPLVTYIEDVADPNLAIYVSPQIEQLTGYTIEEWNGDPELWFRILHPYDKERAIAEDARTTSTGEPVSMEYRIIAKDGHIVWVRDEAVLLRDDEGHPLAWHGLYQDITERREAEEALREAEDRYRTLIETLPSVVYMDALDEASTSIFISQQTTAMLGYTPEDWRSERVPWPEMVHADDRERVLTADRARQVGDTFDDEYRLTRKDGQIIWVRDVSTIVGDDQGRPMYSLGFFFDVTQRKVVERQLLEAQERYRLLVEHIPAMLYVDTADEHEPSLYVSPQSKQVLGVPAEEYMADGDLWLRHVHPDDRQRILGAYRRSLADAEGWAVEYKAIRPDDGRLVWVRDESVFLFDEHGEPTLIQGVVTDITERKLAEEALRDSERREREAVERLRALDEMKNRFLAAVSHELRSPLASILGAALTVTRPDVSDEDRTDLLDRLAQNARKLDRLLSDLIDIDRLSRGILTPVRRPTDLGALVRRTIQSLDILGDRSIRVEADPVVVPMEAAKVERIVENLISNAVRHTSPEARIWVRVSHANDGALLVVEDDGPGVPEDLREAIFEPFRQGPTGSSYAPGTGIGLSLVAMFAELHGGHAWVEERHGGGASFHVFFPAVFEADDTTGNPSDGARQGYLDPATG